MIVGFNCLKLEFELLLGQYVGYEAFYIIHLGLLGLIVYGYLI